ncbi:PP2C family protein-serine/threonine phosphatase [Paludisphaera borealis]|nr:SpoIIE family protein phosphatase [Paludisphaera borealis]
MMTDPRDASILVVDDDPGMLRAVSRILARRQHRVVCVDSGAGALAQAKTSRFDLAIVDVRLPEMNGFDVTRALKKDAPDIDVIIMTGNAEEPDENLLRAIDEGAFYFIQKPFDRRVLLALVNRCLELRRLREERERFLDRVERELEEARQFQVSLLPPAKLEVRGLSIAARYQACSELAGDIYDYVETRDGGVALLIADVVGHGVSAAMMTGLVTAGFRASHVDDFEPMAVVDRIREGLRDFDPGRFVTLCCARLNPGRDALEYVNAGHPEPIIRRADKTSLILDSTGPILSSALFEIPCERESISFGAGDSLLLYTDGVTEARGPRGMFGRDQLVGCFQGSNARAGDFLDELLDAVNTYNGSKGHQDDVTLLSLDRE